MCVWLIMYKYEYINVKLGYFITGTEEVEKLIDECAKEV